MVARNLTEDHFNSRNDFEDDQSDAFRHFVWAGLTANGLGSEKASQFLTAHEDFPENNKESKNMDLNNNQIGIQYGINYRGGNIERDIVQVGKEKIKTKELTWIKR